MAGTVSGKGDQTFKATKQQQIDKATYLYGTVNGKSGWISKYYLTAPSKVQALSTQSTPAPKQVKPSTQTVNQIAQVKANNSGIRASVYDKTAKSGTNTPTVHSLSINNVLKVITRMYYFKMEQVILH